MLKQVLFATQALVRKVNPYIRQVIHLRLPHYSNASMSIGLGLLLLPSHLLAAGGNAGGMVIVADSRNLTGLTAWWVNIYNESHFYFALLTVVAIPLGGAIMGGIADLLMGRIGIDLRSRSLREN
jgi:hypothetical protein